MTNDTGIVPIHGKDYKTVALRVNELRRDHELGIGIRTEVLHFDEVRVIVQAHIVDKDGVHLASGTAEEIRESSNINKTSALENAETSAVGRALAFLGYAGSEIASADEVFSAAAKQEVNEMVEHIRCADDNILSIVAIKQGIGLWLGTEEQDTEALSSAAEAWFELSDTDKTTLWRATTKGGIFTTKEREVIHTNTFRDAHYGSKA